MELYSYKFQEPDELPYRIRLDDNSTRTSLSELTVEELQSLGFEGPIVKPEFDEETQKLQWNGTSYDIVDLNEEELKSIEIDILTKKYRSMSYESFWNNFVNSSSYKKLSDDKFCSELNELFSNAKLGNPDVNNIQKYINAIFFKVNLSDEEVMELQRFIDESYLSVQYSLPDKFYLHTYSYDEVTNTILEPSENPKKLNTPTLSPFPSWVLIDGRWRSPVEIPDETNRYNWDEENLEWILED